MQRMLKTFQLNLILIIRFKLISKLSFMVNLTLWSTFCNLVHRQIANGELYLNNSYLGGIGLLKWFNNMYIHFKRNCSHIPSVWNWKLYIIVANNRKSISWAVVFKKISFQSMFFSIFYDAKIETMRHLEVNLWSIKAKEITQVIATIVMTLAYYATF